MSEGETPHVAGFEQLAPVAAGGFGSVYRAVDEHIGRVVAIKVLDKVDTTDARARDRFLRETRAMGTLSGLPHIVDIYQATFTAEGRPCIVMPYLAGGSLGDVLRARGRLSPDEVITLGATIARALESAHRRGISHRDIKPENILIDEVGDPGLADFGIAMTADSQASTRTRLALSPEHAPPERLNPPTGTTPPETLGDIYSLASTLYTLLAGRTPFGTEAELGSYEFIKRVVEQPPPPITSADVNPQLQTVLDKALAKDPYSRYATALELATALETIPHTPISTAPQPASHNVPQAATESDAELRPTRPLSEIGTTPSVGDSREPFGQSATSAQDASEVDHRETVYRERAPRHSITSTNDRHRNSRRWAAVAAAIAVLLLILGASAVARSRSTTDSDRTVEPGIAGPIENSRTSAKTVVAVGAADDFRDARPHSGAAFNSSDAGQTWVAASPQPPSYLPLNGVASHGTHFVAVGNAGAFTSSDGGGTWVPAAFQPPGTTNLMGVASNGSNFVAVAADGLVYTSPDDGRAWAKATVQPAGAENLRGITSNGARFVAVDLSGKVFTSSDNGLTWSDAVVQPPGAEFLTGVASNGLNFVAVDQKGRVFASPDDGQRWSAVASSTTPDGLSSVASNGPNFVAVGFDGSAFTSSDNGHNWAPATVQPSAAGQLNSVASNGANFVAVDLGGRAFISVDNGKTWKTSSDRTSEGMALLAVVFG